MASIDSREELEDGQAATEDWGTWQDKRQRKFLLAAEATAEQKLAWLEEALKLALLTGALPRKRPPG